MENEKTRWSGSEEGLWQYANPTLYLHLLHARDATPPLQPHLE